MAGANSNVQLTELDFNTIKTNLKTFLQSQDTLKDYNYDGSALSTLLDILAYNTQYNAFYLNMVGNEMFLDTAIQRSSVVSQAKTLGYIPKSAIAPSATINLKVNQVTDSSLTLPKFTSFMSEAIDGINYNFVTADSKTVNTTNNIAYFNDVVIKQGIPATISFTVDLIANPSCTFEIPESNIDTTTLDVTVQASSSNSTKQLFTPATSFLTLTGSDTVYFLQESVNGLYQVTFGDGILGQKLVDGNVVTLKYIVTKGSTAAGANNFVLMDTVSGYSNNSIFPIVSATQGGDKESIDSIKFQAPKSFAAQGRAVSKNDYITAIQQNTLGISFDAVNVWGGEQNDPPVYGQVFVSLKPAGSYNLTSTQKQRIISEVIKPISVLTVTPTIVDPDYTYLKLTLNVYYDPSKTSLTSSQIQTGIQSAVRSFASTTLNTFNSTFNAYELLNTIQSYDSSIITSEYDVQVQKKFFPNLTVPTTYNLYYNTPLQKGIFLSGVSSSPATQFRDPTNLSNIIDGIFIEEIPSTTVGVDTISVINPGFGYQSAPTVTILGDGTGATAHAVLSGGSIKNIVVDTAGVNYTSAIAVITPADGDTTGQLAAAVVNLQGRYGSLRSYYNNNSQVKTVFISNIGTIDYTAGVITLNAFSPIDVDSPLGQLTVTAKPTTSIISSTYNRIITIDPYDPTAVTVNVIAKTS
jgi:hypothetical protein